MIRCGPGYKMRVHAQSVLNIVQLLRWQYAALPAFTGLTFKSMCEDGVVPNSHLHTHVLVELANNLLPFLNGWVLFVTDLCLGGAEDERLLVLHIDSELVVYVGGWSGVRGSTLHLDAPVRETNELDLLRSQVNRSLDNARLVKVIIFDSALAAQGHVTLIIEDDSLLAKRAAQEQGLITVCFVFRSLCFFLWPRG